MQFIFEIYFKTTWPWWRLPKICPFVCCLQSLITRHIINVDMSHFFDADMEKSERSRQTCFCWIGGIVRSSMLRSNCFVCDLNIRSAQILDFTDERYCFQTAGLTGLEVRLNPEWHWLLGHPRSPWSKPQQRNNPSLQYWFLMKSNPWPPISPNIPWQ